MTLSATSMRKLASLGLTADQMAGVLDVMADVADGAPKRSAHAERQARYRERQASLSVTQASPVTSQSDAKVTPKPSQRDASPRAHVEDKTLFLEMEPQEQESKKEVVPSLSRETSPREILLSVLDEETAEAVMKHRKAKRSPLSTGMAARGLVKAFSEYPGGAREAAEMMVTNGWTGFKREYWDKGQPRGSPRLTGVEAEREKLRQEIENERREGEADQNSGYAVGLLEFDREGFDRTH